MPDHWHQDATSACVQSILNLPTCTLRYSCRRNSDYDTRGIIRNGTVDGNYTFCCGWNQRNKAVLTVNDNPR